MAAEELEKRTSGGDAKTAVDDPAAMKPGISRRTFLIGSAAASVLLGAAPELRAGATSEAAASGDSLEESFRNPPQSSQPWAYWWWLNGYVTKEAIVKDLDSMKLEGVGGALVFNASGGPTPKSIEFMSQEWRDLFRYAVEEASKREIEISLNLCSGWDCGGPWITASEAPQELVFSKVEITGPKLFSAELAEPPHEEAYYRDVMVVAYRLETPAPGTLAPTHPETYPVSYPEGPSEGPKGKPLLRYCVSDSAVDLSTKMSSGGHLEWQAPDGKWLVLRVGQTPLKADLSRIKLSGPHDEGYEVDPFRADVMDKHFAATAGELLPEVQKWAGKSKTLQYFHIDSWEIGRPNWTLKFRDEFKIRRGYDLLPYVAVLAGESIGDPERAARFMEDMDRTISDLTAENYYGRLAELSHQHGIGTHPESEGPELNCEDSLRALGTGDIPMAEFWSRMTQPDGYVLYDNIEQRRWLDGVKGAASAAHIYGKPIVQAEAFTVLAAIDWSEYPFALKEIGDSAFCRGLNRNVLCFWILQPELDTIPGYEWPRTGMKMDRNVTWHGMSHAWLRYLTRCQFLFQRGRFNADVCYFYGEQAPNYVRASEAQSPPLPKGYDCDSIDAQALLSRMTVQDGRLRLPGGPSYRVLVMPHHPWSMPPAPLFPGVPGNGLDFVSHNVFPGPGNGLPVGISAPMLRKIKELVENGATILGPKPTRAPGLTDYPRSDVEIKQLADELWGDSEQTSGERKVGKGRVFWGKRLEDIFDQDGVRPDFTFQSSQPWTDLRYIHYSIDGADCYFVSNQGLRDEKVTCTFRVSGRTPELWDAVTGRIRDLPQFDIGPGSTTVEMEFAPRQSSFVFFRKPAGSPHPASKKRKNFPRTELIREISGPWELAFDAKWGGPATITFDRLQDWTLRPEEGIRYYSGTARYSKTFDAPEKAKWDRLFLDLGVVNYLATVRLNGKDLGVVWTAPWRIEITGALKPRGNIVEIDVVNLWPNRLIGDAKLSASDRFTKTNVRPDPGWQPLPSGLLGPVTIQGQLI